MKKKFSVLKADGNGEDIIKGAGDQTYISDEELHGEYKGETGLTYFTENGARRVCIQNGRKLLKSKSEVEQFINFFPGKDIVEKISHFVSLFGLNAAGYWNPSGEKKRKKAGYAGYVVLSKADQDGLVYGVSWDRLYNCGVIKKAAICWFDKQSAMPVVTYRDCKK